MSDNNNRFVLCQDCLKVLPFTENRHEGLDFCDCGGQFCGCDACVETITLLRSGERSKEKLGLQVGILRWTEDGGCRP